MAALGYDPEKLHILIYQVVRLRHSGELVTGGQRDGDGILLSDLIEQVGRDAARFFFLLRSSDTELHFDLDLAVREAAENPVYYVQYAHARIAGILRTAEEKGIAVPDPTATDLTPMTDKAEIAFMRRLTDYPEEIITAAELFEPHRLARYALELAREFHLFYDCCPVLKDGHESTRASRLALCDLTARTLEAGLGLLGIDAPERM